MIMTNLDLVKKAVDIANTKKTLYVKGGWGAYATNDNKIRYMKMYEYNRTTALLNILFADPDVRFFDCICFIKYLLWSGKSEKAEYEANGVPDCTEIQMLNYCTDISSDFNHIVPGELVYLPGHVGLYIGNNLVVECTAASEGRVIISTFDKKMRDEYYFRAWQSHGKLSRWIDYVPNVETATPVFEKDEIITIYQPIMVYNDAYSAILKRGVCYEYKPGNYFIYKTYKIGDTWVYNISRSKSVPGGWAIL